MSGKRPTRRRFLVAAIITGGLGLLSIAHSLKMAQASWLEMFSDTREQNLAMSDRMATDDGVVAEGHLVTYPGAQVALAPEISGRIANLAVSEQQEVHKGDLIARLGSDEIHAALDEARFRHDEAAVDIEFYQTRIDIIQKLSDLSVASPLELLECRHNLELARTKQKEAAASIERFEAQLNKTSVLAPIDGKIIERFAHAGQVVDPQTPIVTIADLSKTRIEAEVNEFDAGKVAIGSTALVTAEGFPNKRWRAKVEEIPDVVVSRHLRPQDPGRPTDTGVLLVKLILIDRAPLRLGQRVELRIEPPRGNLGADTHH